MALFFKELTSTRGEQPSAQTAAVWIHPSGQLAILVDHGRAPAAGQPDLAALDDRLGGRASDALGDLAALSNELAEVPPLAGARDVALLFCDGRHVAWQIRGDARVLAAEGLSTQFRTTGVQATAGTATLTGGEFFLAVSGGVGAEALAPRLKNVQPADYGQLRRAVDATSTAGDWRALLFPAEAVSSFINPAWPENPFVGVSESQPHERLGLYRLADALMQEPDFTGFRIIGGRHFALGVKRRFLDGLLASPWGVFLFELKHDYGRVRLEMQTRNEGMITSHPDGCEIRRVTNPVFKAEEALGLFKDDDIGVRLDPNLRKGALLLFTNPSCQVNCVDGRGTAYGLPFTCGNVLINRPATAAEQIRLFTQKISRSGSQPPLTRAVIDRIVDRLGGPAASSPPVPAPGPSRNPAAAKASPKAPVPPALRVRRFRIEQQPIEEESTPRYDVLRVEVDDKDRTLWAKRYPLTSMGHAEDLQDEVARVGREIAALQDLARHPGVQKYWEHFVDTLYLYVIVESPDGVRLDHWLEREKPDRKTRLAVLTKLAEGLSSLASESIVHRALVPANVRVMAGQVTLTNFELCQLTSVATVDSRAREGLDESYLSIEALTPGRQLGPADDSYSFGKLASLVLAGRLPFGRRGEDAKFIARPAAWNEFAREHGLTPAESEGLRLLLSRDRQRRPVGAELVRMVEGWAADASVV
jgi:hypothetical protein